MLRGLEATAGEGSAADRARRRFESRLARFPEALVPYLEYRERGLGEEETLLLAREIGDRPGATAELLVEIAKFHYLRAVLSVGDAYIERAKAVDPSVRRIYDEEAWNQRARGNVHREIHAVEQSIALAPDEATKLYWRTWLGEALIRQDRFEEAWEHLQLFRSLSPDDERLLSAAYCASVLGHEEEARAAYRRFAPQGADGFDLARVADEQFNNFQRAQETARLLEDVDEDPGAATGLLELSALAHVHLGELDTAVAQLRRAADRPDRAGSTRERLGFLLELTGRTDEALEAYLTIEDREATPLARFRRGALLSERGEFERAVASYLRGVDVADRIPRELLDGEVDPQLPALLAELDAAADAERWIAALRQVTDRASGEELHLRAALLLATGLAARSEWEDAWAIMRRAQTQRLPWLPLTVESRSTLHETIAIPYAEFCETEPIRTDTVLYEASLGAGTSCNPLAICRELLGDADRAGLTHVWSIAPGATIHPSLKDLPNVVFVRKGSLGHFRYLASAGYLVNNSTSEYELVKRAGQRYLNTWHGVPWKTMGRDNRSEPFAYGNISRNLLHADVVLCPDPHTLDVLSRGHDVDQLAPEIFVRAGFPRNDLAVNLPDRERAAIRRALGVSDGEKLVLYMPTWKGTFTERNAEVQEVVDTARSLASPGVAVALRAHHYVSSAFANAPRPEGFVFAPPEVDTNELIGAADALVTDFSSVLFDAAAVGLPVVKLIGDIDAYSAERGLYFTADEVPGANAGSAAEARELLREAVRGPAAFTSRYAEQTARFSAGEDGTSARRAIELLFGDGPVPAPSRERSLLLSTGGLPPNGITRSVRSLLHALRGSGYAPYLIPGRNALDGAEAETLADIRRDARVLPYVGQAAGTRMEQEAQQFFSTRRYMDFPLAKEYVARGRRREADRLFGRVVWDSAVEFSAYDSKNIALVNDGVRVGAGGRGVIFHNEMWKEVESKYPRLKAGLVTMDRMSFLASVSDGVRDYNAETMHAHLGVPREKHITIENTINVEELRALAATPLDPIDESWYASGGAHACVIARLSHEKNHAQLFEALAACRDDLSRPVKLTCMGEGPLRLELERRIRELGIGDLVRMRGLVPNPQAHLRAAGALILPSLHEGQPLVLLEALTVGTPVVATETPGSRSVLRDGEFGPLVPISFEGLVEALHRVADGRLEGSGGFDPEAFTAHSLRMFLDAIAPASDSSVRLHL